MLQEFINGPLDENEKFHLLLALVWNKLPYYAVDVTIRAGYGSQFRNASASLGNVRLGRVRDLPALCALVKHSMPEFDIPNRLLPAGTFALS